MPVPGAARGALSDRRARWGPPADPRRRVRDGRQDRSGVEKTQGADYPAQRIDLVLERGAETDQDQGPRIVGGSGRAPRLRPRRIVEHRARVHDVRGQPTCGEVERLAGQDQLSCDPGGLLERVGDRGEAQGASRGVECRRSPHDDPEAHATYEGVTTWTRRRFTLLRYRAGVSQEGCQALDAGPDCSQGAAIMRLRET